MPQTGPLAPEAYNLIRNWISHIPVPTPTPTPMPNSGADEYKISHTLVGIEQFLNHLKRLYFQAGNSSHIQRFAGLSNNWRPFWGGGCDFYTSSVNKIENGAPVWDNPTHVCDDVKVHKGPLGDFSIIKEGARINVCEYFSDSDSHLNEFFAKKIVPDQNFNKANAEKVFQMYYPALNFTDAIYDGFVNSAKTAHPAIATDAKLMWRLYLSTLCQSLYWEAM